MPNRTRTIESPEVRTRQIVDAAMRVFARKGVQQSSVDAIVEDAGISKGLVYLYFKSKDALVEAVMKRLFAPDLKLAERLLHGEGAATERLLEYARLFAVDVERYRRLLPLFFEYYGLLGRSRKLRDITGDYYRQQEGLLKALVQQGIDAGEFRGQDAETAAFTLLALQEGLIMRWMMQPETTDWASQAVAAMETVLRGMAAPGRANPPGEPQGRAPKGRANRPGEPRPWSALETPIKSPQDTPWTTQAQDTDSGSAGTPRPTNAARPGRLALPNSGSARGLALPTQKQMKEESYE